MGIVIKAQSDRRGVERLLSDKTCNAPQLVEFILNIAALQLE